MKTREVLMPFEELLQILLKTNHNRLLDRLFKLHSLPDLLPGAAQALFPLSLFQEEFEKFHGTWWEVQIQSAPCPDSTPLIEQCLYTADSLSDAVRLKPHLEISFQALTAARIENAFDENQDWMDEPEENERIEIEPYL